MTEPHDLDKVGRALTPMQTQVVRLCSLGCTVKQIASILGLSPHTVENHKTAAMKRVGATNSAMLTRYAMAEGISPPGDELTESERALLDAAAPPHEST
ncbi:MAG: helix-turn-helix transcriptional regulator [Planctomycetes bacterium]|nr:helix-turn-helix transcriptional regulator [Planctomycetota bacterium]